MIRADVCRGEIRPRHTIGSKRCAMSLRSLFVDFNGYFASVEQHEEAQRHTGQRPAPPPTTDGLDARVPRAQATHGCRR